jgi:flagellar biogenesis protein FliO
MEAKAMGLEVGALLMLLYLGSILFVILIVLSSLWRSMKAQESMARSLKRIEELIAQDRERG